jgi:hypothetical protein
MYSPSPSLLPTPLPKPIYTSPQAALTLVLVVHEHLGLLLDTLEELGVLKVAGHGDGDGLAHGAGLGHDAVEAVGHGEWWGVGVDGGRGASTRDGSAGDARGVGAGVVARSR